MIISDTDKSMYITWITSQSHFPRSLSWVPCPSSTLQATVLAILYCASIVFLLQPLDYKLLECRACVLFSPIVLLLEWCFTRSTVSWMNKWHLFEGIQTLMESLQKSSSVSYSKVNSSVFTSAYIYFPFNIFRAANI